MDSIQSPGTSYFDTTTVLIYSGILLLLIALYFIRKNLYRLDVYFHGKHKTPTGYIGKPWHVSWSFILGIVLFLTQLLSSGEADRFHQEYFGVFFNTPHPWHWFWLCLFLAEAAMGVVVVYQSLKHFGIFYGLIRSIILILLMCIFFMTGMYLGLLFVAVVGGYIIYLAFNLFYGRNKGLLTK